MEAGGGAGREDAMYILEACPRCGGALHDAWLDEDLLCLQCGYVRVSRPPVPLEARPGRRFEATGPRIRRKRHELDMELAGEEREESVRPRRRSRVLVG